VNGEIPGGVVLLFFVFVFGVGRGERPWCVSGLGRTDDFSEAAIMETKGFPMESIDEGKLPYAVGKG
jgi:hypothetical protein